MSGQRGQGRRQPAASTTNRKGQDMGRSKSAAQPDEPAVDAEVVEWPRVVRTTFGETVAVGEAEYIDLSRQGLIAQDEVGEVTHGNGVVESGVITDQPGDESGETEEGGEGE